MTGHDWVMTLTGHQKLAGHDRTTLPTKDFLCPAFAQSQESELHLHPQHLPQRVFKLPPVLTLLHIHHPTTRLQEGIRFMAWRTASSAILDLGSGK